MNVTALIFCFGISLLFVGIIAFLQGKKYGEEVVIKALIELGIIEFEDIVNKNDEQNK
jgi:hypothetical protein